MSTSTVRLPSRRGAGRGAGRYTRPLSVLPRVDWRARAKRRNRRIWKILRRPAAREISGRLSARWIPATDERPEKGPSHIRLLPGIGRRWSGQNGDCTPDEWQSVVSNRTTPHQNGNEFLA